MRRSIVFALVVIALFPYSLERTVRLGYDYPIYYNAGRGDLSHDFTVGAWVYSDRLAVDFEPLAKLKYPHSFGLFYFATAVAVFLLVRRLFPSRNEHPVLSVVGAILLGGAAFIILRCGNVTGILALLVTNPLGSVLAMCVKPYLAVFVVVHAAGFCHARRKIASAQVLGGQG